MAIPIPNLSLSAGGGGPSGATSNAGVTPQSTNPFTFDNSGWVVNLHSNGASIDAQGSTGAGNTAQSPTAGGALLGGMNPMLLAVAVAAYLLLRR